MKSAMYKLPFGYSDQTFVRISHFPNTYYMSSHIIQLDLIVLEMLEKL